MNRYKGYSKMWFLVLLLVAFVAGCGDNNDAAPLSSAKAITAYSINGATGIITETATPKTIAVTVPFGTVVTSLTATFSTTGASVMVGSTLQTSGTTTNDFTSPVIYTVTAADGTTATYTVTVTVALSSSKAITSYVLSGVTGSITEGTDPKTIAVTVPFGTVVTSLTATFSTTGESVLVGSTLQTSGTTTNDFTSPVTYTVTAANTTTATYIVTVTMAPKAALLPVDLLTAGNFVIFSYTAIANPGAAGTINGDIGVGPGVTSTAITGFSLALDATEDFSISSLVTGKVYAFDYKGTGAGGLGTTPTFVTTASTDMLTAYNDAAGRPTPDFTELYTGDLSGKTLVPGLYKWSNTVLINTDVTLSGSASDVWIFQIAGDLTVAAGGSVPAGIKVLLIGGAKASNVFWQVGGGTGATLGTYCTFEGNILSAKQIIMNTGAVLHGRALAQTQVSMASNAVTQPAP